MTIEVRPMRSDDWPAVASTIRGSSRVVGIRERVGRMGFGPHAGAWRDVVMIERRSTVAGAG